MKDSYEFVAVFEYAEDGISISFPDLPGCLSCATTTEEAIKNSEEVLGLVLYDMEQEKEKIFDMLVNEIMSHDISVMQYCAIFGMNNNPKLPQEIIRKITGYNYAIKKNGKNTRMIAKEMNKEINRINAYSTPYRKIDGEKIGYMGEDMTPVMVPITDEYRTIAKEYLNATDEFICNKTMIATLQKIVKGEITRESLERAKKEKELRSLQQRDKALDETIDIAEKIIKGNRENQNKKIVGSDTDVGDDNDAPNL